LDDAKDEEYNTQNVEVFVLVLVVVDVGSSVSDLTNSNTQL